MQPLNQRIAKARKDLGLTQEQVAKAMNVSRQTVSHWETGRIQPDEVTRKQLFALLHLPEDDQPTVAGAGENRRRPHRFALWLTVAVLCCVLVTLVVLGGLVRRRQANVLPASGTQTEGQQESSFTFAWFQQPDENIPGKAFIHMAPLTSPVPLMEDAQFSSQYIWQIQFTIEEQNGIPFKVERFTEVFFNQEQESMDTYVRVGEECERFWASLTFEANSMCSYNVTRPVGGCIGYGAVLEGRDANGQALTFKVFIPLSQEIHRSARPEDFAETAEPEEGKAFLRISVPESPVPQVYDPVFEGDWGWNYGYVAENTTDVPFTVEHVREVLFRNDAEAFSNTYDQEQLSRWEISCSVTADAPFFGGSGTNCLQGFTGVGVAIEGVDANGNALTFTQYFPFAQEKPQK